ncbi:MAG: T9SS type A sorting domain-containing protein [Chlorobi bacterium]|nr:T9SS type A sorting domain-containing protein [Chlorobiota bacterium]
MRKNFILALILCIGFLSGYSQLNIGGQPLSYQKDLTNYSFPTETMPSFDIPVMEQEDRFIGKYEKESYRFAKSFDVNYSLNNSGSWINLPDGSRVWKLGIYSPHAYSINIIFSKFYLPQGAKLYIYNLEESYSIGGYTNRNNNINNLLATEPVFGDYVVVEYFEPASEKGKSLLTIGTVSHDYRNILKLFHEKDDQFGASGECNVDINCTEGNDWQKVKHSVTRIIIDGSKLCSGALINNTRQDETPYYLTANHCISTTDEAATSIFYFNYESPTCNGIDGITTQTISGSTIKATGPDHKLDFCLLELNDDIPASFNPYFAGWNRSENIPQNTVSIHHPSGDVKKISIDDDPPTTGNYGSTYDINSHWWIHSWEVGTTEGGSSGCPLFDENQRIIGDLTGGEASCSNSVNDYFAKFSMSWADYPNNDEQLKYWLDPDNSGVVTLDGFDPNGGEIAGCDTLSNFIGTSTLYTTQEGGYLAGNNEYGDLAKAEYFESTNSHDIITGVIFYFGAASGSVSNLTFAVWEDNNGEPGNQIGSNTKALSDIVTDVENNDLTIVSFTDAIEINGPFYVGVYLPTEPDEYVGLVTNAEGDNATNTGWEMLSTGLWYPYSSTNSWSISLNHAIFPITCSYVGTEIVPKENSFVNIYPNPVSDRLTIEKGTLFKLNRIIVYNYFGEKVMEKFNSNDLNSGNIEINLSSLSPGFYLVTLISDNEIITKKIVKD